MDINPEIVCSIIFKARMLNAQAVENNSDSEAEMTDEQRDTLLETYGKEDLDVDEEEVPEVEEASVTATIVVDEEDKEINESYEDEIDIGNENVPPEDFETDTIYQDVKRIIDELNEEQQVNLVALMWLGRGTYTKDEWMDAIEVASNEHNEYTSAYLIGTPLLADYLEAGLNEMGHSCEEFERDLL